MWHGLTYIFKGITPDPGWRLDFRAPEWSRMASKEAVAARNKVRVRDESGLA